jgi:hypothetical protein
MDKPRSRLTDTGELPAGQSSGGRRQMLFCLTGIPFLYMTTVSSPQVSLQRGRRQMLGKLLLDARSHDVVWSDKTKEEKMAVDFDALDLVRTQNKARSYNTKLDGLVQENTELRTLVADLTKEMPEGNRKLMYQERLNKIKNSS